MKNYVVGILSFFENDLKLFKISANSEYEAVKKGMLEFCETDQEKQYEIEWQNDQYYPTDFEGLSEAYEEMSFEIVEI